MEQETNTSRDNVGCIISVVEERELREKIVVSRNYKFIRPSFPRIATKIPVNNISYRTVSPFYRRLKMFMLKFNRE